jgi:phosphate transport system permease protein
MLYGTGQFRSRLQLRKMVLPTPEMIGQTLPLWVPADDDVDMLMKGHIARDPGKDERRINDIQLAWIDRLSQKENLEKRFNRTFFTAGDSREPELAGILGCGDGSFLHPGRDPGAVVSHRCGRGGLPGGVRPQKPLDRSDRGQHQQPGRGALHCLRPAGPGGFLNFFGLPRSAPLVGGLVLTLMTLPTIIIASRASLQSVPPSIREAALGVGASKMQMVTHHVLPLACPAC